MVPTSLVGLNAMCRCYAVTEELFHDRRNARRRQLRLKSIRVRWRSGNMFYAVPFARSLAPCLVIFVRYMSDPASQRHAIISAKGRSFPLQVGEVVLNFLRAELAESWSLGTLDALDTHQVVCWWPDNTWYELAYAA